MLLREINSCTIAQCGYIFDRLRMIDCLQMLAERFSFDRETFFHNERSFSARQRIALNRVTGIRQFDAEPIVEIADKSQGEWPIGIKTLLFCLKCGEYLFHIYKV